MSFPTTNQIKQTISRAFPSNNSMYLSIKKTKPIQICYSYRDLMITKLKGLMSLYIPDNQNKLDIFYLSVLYLDTILSNNPPSLDTENNRNMISLTCFNIALKFLGSFNININYIIRLNTRNCRAIYYKYEHKCLLYLKYNLVQTTVYDYLNLIILYNGNGNGNKDKKNGKILPLAKSILYLLIANDIIVKYDPFIVAIALIKYCKETIGINTFNYYDRYFQNEDVRELSNIIRKEYCKDNEEERDWDLKTMSSTMENRDNNDTKEDDSTINSSNINLKESDFQNKYWSEKKKVTGRNKSVHNSIKNNLGLSNSNRNINIYLKGRDDDKIRIDLGQMSKISIDKLTKLSTRFLKTEK